MTTPLSGTDNELEARNHIAAVSVEFAKLKTKARDRGALALADRARAYNDGAKPNAANAWGRATIYADLAAIYRTFGREGVAMECAQKSEHLWSDMKVPSALEAQRERELAAVRARFIE